MDQSSFERIISSIETEINEQELNTLRNLILSGQVRN